MEGIKCLAELESPILIFIAITLGEEKGIGEDFLVMKWRFVWKQKRFEIVREIQPRKILNTWLKNFVFPKTYCRKSFISGIPWGKYVPLQRIQLQCTITIQLCWPFCLIHRLMRSARAFLLPFVMFSLMFPIPSWLLSVFITAESCAGLWC